MTGMFGNFGHRRPAAASAPLGRGDRSALGRWFWTIDKTLLTLILALMACGIMAVTAASPVAARKLSGGGVRLDDLHFLYRQLFWVGGGLIVMVATSMLDQRGVRRLGVLGTLVCLAVLALLPFIGQEKNGAVRWLVAFGMQVQPSEFFKPCFIVATAWLLSLKLDDRAFPGIPVSGVVLGAALLCLALQPDMGQSALITLVWLAQAALAGMPLGVLAALGALGLVGAVVAYFSLEYFAERVDKFLFGTGDNFQIERALDCFRAGGWFGVGPGEGVAKFKLPEAQNDYIFSVIGEEFGIIACCLLAGLFAALVLHALMTAMEEEEPFVFLAVAGLASQIGLQAVINMLVNLDRLPSKGMTLPFISHGGSSFLGMSLAAGLLLALTRCNPYLKGRPWAGEAGRWA